MGSSISKAKTSSPQSRSFCSSTTSSERTMVESVGEVSKKIFGSSKKPSILPDNKFFNNFRNKSSKEKPRSANVNSMARRRPNQRRKRVAIVVTKSIIGRPTNFKHLNSSTAQSNHMQCLHDDEDEAAKVAAQMAILSSLIKPLPNNDKAEMPIIPARSSSYDNAIYIKELSLPVSKATSSIKKNRKKVVVVGMQNASISRSSIARKRAQQHIRSAKRVY